MALLLDGKYYVIINSFYVKGFRTNCELLCYPNKESRDESFGNYIKTYKKSFSFEGELSIDELYSLIKKTKEFLTAIDV